MSLLGAIGPALLSPSGGFFWGFTPPSAACMNMMQCSDVQSPYEKNIALCQESPQMVLSPILEHVVARPPIRVCTFRAVSIQKVVEGEMASALHSPGFGGE